MCEAIDEFRENHRVVRDSLIKLASVLEKKELEFIAEHVDEIYWGKFWIPIILEMTSIGSEYVIFVRDKLHAEFISKAFGIDRFTKQGLMLYSYEMQKVRKKLRTATQVFFRV